MKNILFILIACLLVTFVNAAPAADSPAQSRRDELIQLYTQKDQFLTAAKAGDIARLNELGERARGASFFLVTDKFGNNAFHLSKDAQTIQVIAYWIRQCDNHFTDTISTLRNQRNQFGETPLMTHINYGKTDTFQLLYTGSQLEKAVRDAKSANKGGALSVTAGIKNGIVRSYSQDNSGRSVAEAARANSHVPGMDKIIAFFAKNAPYL